MQLSLTNAEKDVHGPLAARMRPLTLNAYLGQEHLLAKGKPLQKALQGGNLHSMVFWGPPGVGKTTLARLIASLSDVRFEALSAVLSGVKDIRAAIARAKEAQQRSQNKTLLFIDEVHRFNKSQQDAFLPHIEEGTVIFVGATTENPSFELNSALLSRVRVYVLKPLDKFTLQQVLKQALEDDERGLGHQKLVLEPEAEALLINHADGDARRLLNALEIAAEFVKDGILQANQIASVLSNSHRRFDNCGDVFYDQISAFHKSVRGSSPDAALYWAARIVDGGADPLYIIRRLVAIASEDIGNADPRALEIAINAWQVFERLGSPEGLLALAQATVYCACAPKSNAVYKAWQSALSDVKNNPSYDVPMHLRNAPTAFIHELGCKKEYRYAHDETNGYAAGEVYFPETMTQKTYYYPNDRGLEIKIKQKLKTLNQWDKASQNKR